MPKTQAETRPLVLREGDEPIDGFRLIRRRGRGGFGEVWEARASGGIHVALKFVRRSARAHASELDALRWIAGLRHPNLLANFGWWEVDDAVIVGMELADGSLWDRYIEVANEGLRGIPRSELLGYMADAASGVDYLNGPRHTVEGRCGMGIQHRDLKPPNILLFGGGAKVADLGMARAMDGEHAAHAGIWTFSYAAPEFFRGVTTGRSDQYGLAATYCQLRCGTLPFEGNAASVTAGHLYGHPDLGELPEAERPILERALAKEPADRWPDCRSFIEALRAIDRDEVPEILLMPDDPTVDIARMPRPPAGPSIAPASSWDRSDAGSDLDSLLSTSDRPTFAPSDTGESDDPPARFARPRRWLARPRRWLARAAWSAASALAVGFMLLASSVRTVSQGHQVPPSMPSPVHASTTAPAPVRDAGKAGPRPSLRFVPAPPA